MITMSIMEIVEATNGSHPTWKKLIQELNPIPAKIVAGRVVYEVNSIKELKTIYNNYKTNNMKKTGRKPLNKED